MERRKAIKNIGLGLGAFVATPAAMSILQSCGGSSLEPWKPKFFSEAEGVFLRRVLDAMIPASGELPSATTANVHVFVDKYVNEVYDVDDKGPTRESMKVTFQGLLEDAGEENIASVKTSAYVAFLGKYLNKSKEEHEATEKRIWEYRDANGSEMGMPAADRIYSFLTGLRGRAVWAYQRSELVGKTILAYKPVPGEQQGCIDVQEATGGRAWALN